MSFSITPIPGITVQYLYGVNGLPQFIRNPVTAALAPQIPIWLQIRQ